MDSDRIDLPNGGALTVSYADGDILLRAEVTSAVQLRIPYEKRREVERAWRFAAAVQDSDRADRAAAIVAERYGIPLGVASQMVLNGCVDKEAVFAEVEHLERTRAALAAGPQRTWACDRGRHPTCAGCDCPCHESEPPGPVASDTP